MIDKFYKTNVLCIADKQRQHQIMNILQQLILTKEKTEKVDETFTNEVNLALTEQPSSLQMENTYIPELPNGTEDGQFLALDLGGTNFRAILLHLEHGNVIREEVKRYHIPDELRTGSGLKLFDFLAECLVDFVSEQDLEDVPLPLGFTFSFPMSHHSLDSGYLVTWTKTFNCPDVVNMDVVKLLQQSLEKYGHNHIEVMAILNDTTGTLVEGARIDNRTRIGIVLGTGSNACYVERADRVQHWETERHNEHHVIINIEWGAFGDNGSLDFLKTEFDRSLDLRSLLATSFTFEKYISGNYLGELVRTVLETLWDKKLFLTKAPPELFPLEWNFTSDLISLIEQDTIDGQQHRIKKILSDFGYEQRHYDDDDLATIQFVSALTSYRAAKLVSITTAIMLNRMDEEDITIAIDGSLYKHHPRMKTWLEDIIAERAPNKLFRLILAEDGSGKGAGLAAAIAVRVSKCRE
ncbi:hexokinase type 2-like [Bradysia coprophila]|uniref:hexokinase type 2-like n=1 Tax=Bradysia coprophila TaxID=38358 RepID=UPI00187DBE30|nr:hexokinase type 2-like [Bradysia coprophila]